MASATRPHARVISARSAAPGAKLPGQRIKNFMTTAPHSIGVDQTLAQAHAFLKKHHVRHLPVLSGGSLVGILTERDLS